MNKCLAFAQMIIAVFIGSLANDIFQDFTQQCVAKDRNGCAETRIECVWNSRTTPSVIHSCFIESMV